MARSLQCVSASPHKAPTGASGPGKARDGMELSGRDKARLGFGMDGWKRTVHEGNREAQSKLRAMGALDVAADVEPAAILATCKRYVEQGRMTEEQARKALEHYGIL